MPSIRKFLKSKYEKICQIEITLSDFLKLLILTILLGLFFYLKKVPLNLLFSVLSILYCLIGSILLTIAFLPIRRKWIVSKTITSQNGKIINQTSLIEDLEGVPENQIPPEIKNIYKDTDLNYTLFCKKNIKKNKD